MIPFADLKAQYHGIKQEIDAAIADVLENSTFILGPDVAAFEREFAAYSGADYGIGVNSGTSALHLALLAAGIGPGDEVITTPYTFVATVAAIRYVGARPVFADIDARSYTIDPAEIEKAITARTKAIVPVHLYGQTADMDPILEIARGHDLVVIEDAAQAHGAEYRGRRAGSMGQLACFSFYPGKNLGAYGEGGMVVTSDPEYARVIRMLRDWGMEQKYYHVLQGYNYRLEGMQGAILRVKLKHLDDWTAARQRHAALYTELLADSGAVTPPVMSHGKHVFHVYALMAPNRDEIHRELAAQGIQTGIHYPYPVYELPAHADLGYKRGDCPNAERAAARELSLPIYPELTRAQIEQVCRCVREALARVPVSAAVETQ
jgi:dTDP-4-amino-4,6-dideoxygalactose transaminase